jgi:hypothetical protein
MSIEQFRDEAQPGGEKRGTGRHLQWNGECYDLQGKGEITPCKGKGECHGLQGNRERHGPREESALEIATAKIFKAKALVYLIKTSQKCLIATGLHSALLRRPAVLGCAYAVRIRLQLRLSVRSHCC